MTISFVYISIIKLQYLDLLHFFWSLLICVIILNFLYSLLACCLYLFVFLTNSCSSLSFCNHSHYLTSVFLWEKYLLCYSSGTLFFTKLNLFLVFTNLSSCFPCSIFLYVFHLLSCGHLVLFIFSCDPGGWVPSLVYFSVRVLFWLWSQYLSLLYSPF